jgi:hypothetical protein
MDGWLYEEMVIRNGRDNDFGDILHPAAWKIYTRDVTWIVHQHKLKLGEN